MNDWRVDSLGSLASIRRGISYSEATLQDNEEDGRPYINMKSFLKDGGYNKNGLKFFSGHFAKADVATERSLLLANTDVTLAGDIIGVPALLPPHLQEQGVLFSHHVTQLLLREQIKPKFLYYLLCTGKYRRRMHKYARGTTVLMLDMGGIKNISIEYPGDHETQDRIAAVLMSIDTAIEKTEALIAKYQRIKAGLMQELFTRGLLPDGQLRPPRERAPALYQETSLGWFPKEWTKTTLRNAVGGENIVNGPFGSDLLTSELRKEGVPVLYVQDIKAGAFHRVSLAHVTRQKADQLAFCNVRKGDVLIAKVGSPPCDSCVYDMDETAIVTQDVIRLRPTAAINADYVSALLNSPFGRKAIKRISIEGTRERVSLTQFKELTFLIAEPCEQSVVGKRLHDVQAHLELETHKSLKLRSLKIGLMQDLLTGKVPVRVSEPALEALVA